MLYVAISPEPYYCRRVINVFLYLVSNASKEICFISSPGDGLSCLPVRGPHPIRVSGTKRQRIAGVGGRRRSHGSQHSQPVSRLNLCLLLDLFSNASDALRAARADGRHYVPLSLNRLGRVINTHGDILVSNAYDWLDSEISDRRKFAELRNGAKHAVVPRGRQRSAAPVVGHHGHSTAPSR